MKNKKHEHAHHGHDHEHTHDHEVDVPKTSWTDWLPLITVIAFIVGLTILFSNRLDASVIAYLSISMGFFFVFFSLFKLINLPGFAMGYHEYDIISKRWYTWGYIYPFIELVLGFLYLAEVDHPLLHVVTIGLSLIVCIGVGINLAKRELFQCACLGTVLKVPITKVSFIEYAVMTIMAIIMLLIPADTIRSTASYNHGHDTFITYQSLQGEAYDKAFLHEMLEHHQGAVDMARLAAEKSKRPELIVFAKRIQDTQSTEMNSMKQWQNQWYPNSGAMMDHSMHDDMHHMNSELQSLSGDAFDKRFLELMIEHHQDAIDMSASGSTNASRNEIRMLTEQIVLAQSQEVSQMHAWQHAWGFAK